MFDRRVLLRAGAASVVGLFHPRGLSAAVQATTSPYRRPKLKITDVKTAFVRGLHVRIYSDQGLVGHGEAVDAVSGGASIVAGFRNALVGQDPLNVDAIFERLRTSGIFAGAQAGQYVAALTAVEIALWDLAGKAVGLPIYQLLGGRMRDRVRVYCDSATNNRADPNAKQFISQIVDLGFTAAKIDIDDARDPDRFDRVNWTANNAEIDHMVDKVAFMRESLPKRIRPRGCSGARILTTLVHEMRRRAPLAQRPFYGLATLCVGVGQGEADHHRMGGRLNMKVLVTGSTGFIGSQLCRALVEAGAHRTLLPPAHQHPPCAGRAAG